MALAAGSRLGAYEILALLGAGGMGEVYQARDHRLGRDVAIKVLPGEVAADSDRLARFDREARLLASLNHPNIATLLGFESADALRFLVMELVPGETLAERLRVGPLPADEALPIFLQIAEGLEAAHEAGVVHRDLKPANVKVTPEGRVKVLDFGLAKAVAAAEAGGEASRSPTLTALATQRGEIMGTAAYMSPEQARGKPVDRRADIWAFGCVLYEALAGARPFGGETITDILASIVKEEPDWAALPRALPAAVGDLLRRCLEKDARNRLRDIGEARLELSRALGRGSAGASGAMRSPASEPSASVGSPPPRWRLALAVGAALILGAFGGAAIVLGLAPRGAPSGAGGVARVIVEAPPGLFVTTPRLTPDGRTVVYSGTPEAKPGAGPGETRLFARPLDAWESRPIEGTEGAEAFVLSPDGHWAAVMSRIGAGSAKRHVIKVPLDGSVPPLTLADWSESWGEHLVWLPDGDILVAAIDFPLLVRIHTDGSGATEPVKIPGELPWGGLTLAGALPDGRVLATVNSWEGGGYHARMLVLDAKGGSAAGFIDDGANPQWSPSGHILFTRRDTLLAARFDPRDAAPGPPVPIVRGLRLAEWDAGAWFDVSATGVMAYQPGGHVSTGRRLAISDRAGTTTPWSGDRSAFVSAAAVAPGGHRLAITVMREDWLFTVWVSDVDRPQLRLFAAEPQMDCDNPVWHPSGDRVFYACLGRTGRSGIYLAPIAGGGARRIVRPDVESGSVEPRSVSPDGRWLILQSADQNARNLRLLPLGSEPAEVPESAARPLLPSDPQAHDAQFSPDGRFVLYLSRASGRAEVQVRPFDPRGNLGPATLVAVVAPDGHAFWSGVDRDGAPLLAYETHPSSYLAVAIHGGAVATVSEPRPDIDLSKLDAASGGISALGDGRFLTVLRAEGEAGTGKILVVLNWFQELDRLAPPKR